MITADVRVSVFAVMNLNITHVEAGLFQVLVYLFICR